MDDLMEFDELKDGFMEEVKQSFDSVRSATDNIEIANYRAFRNTLNGYATGNIIQFLDYMKQEDFLTRQGFCQDFLASLNELISDYFFIELRPDDIYELWRVYELYVIRRYDTVARVLIHYMSEKFTFDEINKPKIKSEDLTKELLSKIKDNINLEEAFDDWYLDKCRGFHDNVFFETPRQNFFESFFYNTPHEIEEFTENETIISYIKSHIINMRLKIQQEKNK